MIWESSFVILFVVLLSFVLLLQANAGKIKFVCQHKQVVCFTETLNTLVTYFQQMNPQKKQIFMLVT